MALTVAAGAQRRADRPDARQYGVAVARADGTIVPFAEYDRGRWRDLWSGTERGGYPVPLTLDDVDDDWWGNVDPGSGWQLWRRPGVSEVLTATGIRQVGTPCGAQVGLTTNYRPPAPPPPPGVAPYPKAGLATTTEIDFRPIVPVERGSSAWRRVSDAVEGAFHALETRRLFEMQWGHPIPDRERRLTPVTLNVALSVPGSRFHYVEATRVYRDPDPPPDGPPCGLVTYVSGFFWQNGRGELVPVSINTLVSYCHLEDAVYLWPLGVIREGGHAYWLVQTAGWTGEAYGVIEPDDDEGKVRNHVWHTVGQCDRR